MAQGFRRGPCPNSIIACARGDSSAAKLEEVGILSHRVSDPHQLLGFLPRAHSDVDKYFVKFRDLLSIVGFLQVNRQMASHPRNRASSAMHKNPPATQHRAVNTSDTLEV